MTLKEIKQQFQPGQVWHATNTFVPDGKLDGPRTVDKVQSAEIKWNRNGQSAWSPIPQASQVIEARDGYLSYRLFSEKELSAPLNNITDRHRNAVITLVRQ